ncbi:MFS transporter [Glycomyces salinus]|uniref:MFS transporter n=1 Tax=Glycomyces salinus TaxID=980294 RepID=UPI0018EC5F8A|nr:MFS transporter [Glycomyces salinus]
MAVPEGQSPSGTSERASRREWGGLALLVLPMLMLATDLTVLFFALPTLSADLDPSPTQGLWIVHIYGFLIAGCLVAMGRLGDRIGPRKLLLTGSAAFAALSALAAFSVSASMLIAVRALLGIAGATLMPSLYSLLRVMFRDERQRRLAIAIMFSAFSVGGAVGPLIGGALLEFFWWGSVFLINVPPMLLLVLVGPRLLPERRELVRVRIDPASVALSVTGMLAVVYGLQELAAGQETGSGSVWPNLAIAVGGMLVLTVFIRRQRRLSEPLFDLSLLANRQVAVSLATLPIVGIGVTGLFYLFTQYLQWVAELSPLAAGLWTLPFIAVNILGAMSAPALAARFGAPAVVAGGLAVAALGAALVAGVVDVEVSLPVLIGAFAIVGLGQGAGFSLVSDLIISGAPTEQAGSAAAAQEVGGELGTALGVAVGGAVGVFVYRTSLPDSVPPDVPEAAAEEARSSVHEGADIAESLPAHGPELLAAVQEATAQGFQVYAVVGAVLTAAAAVLVKVTLARRSDRAGT